MITVAKVQLQYAAVICLFKQYIIYDFVPFGNLLLHLYDPIFSASSPKLSVMLCMKEIAVIYVKGKYVKTMNTAQTYLSFL